MRELSRIFLIAVVFLIVRVGTLSAADEPATQDTTDALLELLEREPGNVDALSQLYAIYMRQGDYGEAQRYALRISEVAQENGDMHTEMLADSYIGQSWLAMDGYDSAYNYLKPPSHFGTVLTVLPGRTKVIMQSIRLTTDWESIPSPLTWISARR